MKVAELVAARRSDWKHLEVLCGKLERLRRKKLSGEQLARFATLYRAACADLALADAYQLPPTTVRYLNQLVGRAHNLLYRSRRFDFRAWGEEIFVNIPRRLFADRMLWLAMAVFWGFFLASMFLSSDWSPVSGFAERAIGEDQLRNMERMYSVPINAQQSSNGQSSNSGRPGMFGFYVQHNTSIGLRCFAMGLLLGVGGLFATVFNAVMLGTVFGHMTTVPQADNFFDFVTAHGPFELTAIVLSAAAGMRLGFSLVSTGGLTRGDSLRRAGHEAMPTMAAAMVLFAGAALIEGFLSPSAVPYAVKASMAALCSTLLVFYFVVLGLVRQKEAVSDQPSAVGFFDNISKHKFLAES